MPYSDFKFLALENAIAVIDSFLYHFEDGGKIVGILKYFIDNCQQV